MRRWIAALGLALVPAAAAAGTLVVEDGRARLAALEVAEGDEWCLRWNHSVTGGRVADCFVNDGGAMVLTRSYLHDYAAGLGEVPGRGRVRAATGGGYWIEEIGETIADNTLPLRVGRAAVDHRITSGDAAIALSERAAGCRVMLRLIP